MHIIIRREPIRHWADIRYLRRIIFEKKQHFSTFWHFRQRRIADIRSVTDWVSTDYYARNSHLSFPPIMTSLSSKLRKWWVNPWRHVVNDGIHRFGRILSTLTTASRNLPAISVILKIMISKWLEMKGVSYAHNNPSRRNPSLSGYPVS